MSKLERAGDSLQLAQKLVKKAGGSFKLQCTQDKQVDVSFALPTTSLQTMYSME